MIHLISQVTFIFLTQIYCNMNFIPLSSNFSTRFPWYFKINLCQLFLEDNFLAHKKCIFLNMSAILVLRIRNFVKMQGNLWKISCSLPTLLKIPIFRNFFWKFFWQLYFKNINFLTKNKKCLLCWLLWIQNYQITGKYLTSNTTFSKKVNLWNFGYRHIYWWGPGIYYSSILLVYPIRAWNLLNV